MTWDQVSLANTSQLRDYTMVIPEVNDCFFRSLVDMVGVILLLQLSYVYMTLDTCFLYKDL